MRDDFVQNRLHSLQLQASRVLAEDGSKVENQRQWTTGRPKLLVPRRLSNPWFLIAGSPKQLLKLGSKQARKGLHDHVCLHRVPGTYNLLSWFEMTADPTNFPGCEHPHHHRPPPPLTLLSCRISAPVFGSPGRTRPGRAGSRVRPSVRNEGCCTALRRC